MSKEVVHVTETGHSLEVEDTSRLGGRCIIVRSDVTAGDKLQHVTLTAEEMDALTEWWRTHR